MNRDGHLIYGLLGLVIIETLALCGFLLEFGTVQVLWAALWSLIWYINGCCLPDWDHWKVQDKFFFMGFMHNTSDKPDKWYHTKHRGRWHSLGAMGIYGILILGFSYLIRMQYWCIPAIAGMVGFFMHLFLDQLKKWKDRSNAKNTIKLWK